jgi:hypothetical protein
MAAHRLPWVIASLAIIVLSVEMTSRLEAGDPNQSQSRLGQIVEANILAVHAYQVGLVRKTGKGSEDCFSAAGLSDLDLESLVAHQARLLSTSPYVLNSWVQGWISDFDPSNDLLPILNSPLRVPEPVPVNVITSYLLKQTKAPREKVRAMANLYQTVLEVDRDGDLLQQEFDLYIALNVPVYVGQLGLRGTDEVLLVAGKELASDTCSSPFDTDAAAWQIAGRKIWNWGEKKLHIRDSKVLARELLSEPDIKPLTPKMRFMSALKVAVIGHSFTMDLHWSSPSSFVPIVTAMFAIENPRIQFCQFQAGGLTASRALKNFFPEVLGWKPDKVLLVVLARTDEDYEALRTMGGGFAKAGIRTFVFDNLHDPESANPEKVARFNQTAREAGITIIPVDSLLSNAPDRDRFLCLDKIHMTEPYHRLMAKEWLKFLVSSASR